MACNDSGQGGPGKCEKRHINEATIEQLRAVIKNRLKRKVKNEELRLANEAKAMFKKGIIAGYVQTALSAAEKVSPRLVINFVAAEKNRTESLQWKRSELESKLTKWLSDCDPFPLKMKFKLQRTLGRYFLISWHQH